MAPRITLPGGGAIDLDVQEARILNVGLVTAEDTFTPEQAAGVAVPRSYVDRGDIAFYDATTTYLTNQYVLFDNRIWFANTSVTGVEPSSTASQWSELSRPDLFLTITAEDANVIMADNRDHNVTITGGTGIDTTADSATDTLSIDLNAVLDNLTDVSAASPGANQFLQWNGSAWAPADVTGDGFSIVSDGTNTSEVSATRQTVEFSGTGPVAVAVTQDSDSANVAVSVAEATTLAPGLLSRVDKVLLDDVRDGGYSNDDIDISTDVNNAHSITLSDTDGQFSSVSLENFLEVGNLVNVNQGLRDHQVLIYSDFPILTDDLEGTVFNVYIVTRDLVSRSDATTPIQTPSRWNVNSAAPASVVKVTGAAGIQSGVVNHFRLTFTPQLIDDIQNNSDTVSAQVALDDANPRADITPFTWTIPPGASAETLNDLSDVNVSLATQGQVLTRQANGTWVGVDPSAIEDHGGRVWNSVVNYETGDIVSFLISGSRRLFIALRDNTNVEPAAGGNDDWQEASILRLRDIANIDITDDPANNSFLIWNQAESAWEVTSALVIAGLINLGQLNDVNLTGVQEGNTLVYDVDAEGAPVWNASGFTARQLLFSTDTVNTQYHRGELVYTTNDIAYPTDHRDQIYRVNTTFNAPTAAVGFDPFPAGLSYLGERNDHTGVVLDTDIERNAFNEINAINVGGTEYPIRQNTKAGNALPNVNTLAGDIFVLEGSSGFQTDRFVVSDGVITTEVSGDTVLRFTGTENLEDYIHSSDVAVRVNGIPYEPTGKQLNPNAGRYAHSFGIQVIGQPPTLDFTDPTDFDPDDIIEFTYRAGGEVENAGIYYRSADNTTWIRDINEFPHGPQLPVTATSGDVFVLTATEGNNPPGYYYYTTQWVASSGIATGETLPASATPGEGFILTGGGSHTDTFTSEANQAEFTATVATTTPPSADPIEDFLTVTLDGNTIAPTDATNPYQISVIPNVLGPGHNAFAIEFTTALAAGRTVTLTYATDDVSSNGYYYRNGTNTAWVKDDNAIEYSFATTQSGTGVQLQVTETPNVGNPSVESITFSAGTGVQLTAGNDEIIIGVEEDHNQLHPLALWNATTTYSAGDQVIHITPNNEAESFRHTPSLYISLTDNNTGNIPLNTAGATDQTNWQLVRSGLIEVRTNGIDEATGVADTGGAITANAALQLNGGLGGIYITRRNTAFGINVNSSMHGGPETFSPGFGYAYVNLVDNHLYQGVVTAAIATGLTVTAIDGDLNRVHIVVNAGSSHADMLGAFVTTDANVSSFFPGETANRIIYGQFDATGNLFEVLQVEPSVATEAELQSLFGVSNTVNRGGLNISGINILGLDQGHSTATAVYQWALLGDPENIPTDKLQGLRNALESGQVDWRINERWLPADVPLQQSQTVTRTADPTDNDNNETITVGIDGTIGLNLNPYVDEIGELRDVDLTTAPTTGQVLEYDGTHWTAVNITESNTRIRFSATDATSSEVEITGYVTDNDVDSGNFTTVRSANFNGTGGRLQFELARYMAQLGTFADFPTAPNWDVPWSAVTTGNSITIGVNGEDDLFPGTHLQTLSTTQSNITIGGNPRSRGTANRWTVRYTDPSLVLSDGTGLAGGDSPSFIVTATTNVDNISVNSNTGGGEIHWRSASLTTSGRNFGTRQTFLNSYPNYTWTLRTNNITSTNSCVLDFDNSSFRDNANTRVTGAGQTAGNVNGSLSIGGSGNVTFTSTGPFWNNGAALANDDILHEFHRPAGVTGTAYTVDNRVSTGSGQPVFTYPVFHLSTGDGTTVPNFLNGTQANTGNTNKSASFRLGSTGFSLDNRGGSDTRYLWVAYPAASPAVTQIVVTTVASSGATATNTITLSDVQRSSTNVSLRGTGAPASAAEDYRWFWIEVPAGDNVTLGNATQ